MNHRISIVSRTYIITTDGREWPDSDRAAAVAHQDELDFQAIVDDDALFHCGQVPALRQFLLRNADVIRRMLTGDRNAT